MIKLTVVIDRETLPQPRVRMLFLYGPMESLLCVFLLVIHDNPVLK